MADETKKKELRRITKDLEQYVANYCNLSKGEPIDFADEKCNDAALMLQEALDKLHRQD